MSKKAAFDYMRECMRIDLRMRVCDARVDTFLSRLEAIAVLTRSFHENPLSVEAWRTTSDVKLRTMNWSDEQEEFLDIVADSINVRDSTAMAAGLDRWMHITGGPGTGKTEAIIHAAYRAAEVGARVLILCPTGALVHAYKERLPPTDQIVVETLHSGFSIARKVDMNTYAPPGRLRRYDLIFIDEASQIGDDIFDCIVVGVRELPQKPFVVVGADYQQVAPIGGGKVGRGICDSIKTIELKAVHRTDDPKLLAFLNLTRKKQPSRAEIREFFGERLLDCDLQAAVKYGLAINARSGKLFVWLCVTNKGVRDVNLAAISQLDPPITEEDLTSRGFPTDPSVGKHQYIVIRGGITIRLTKNIDKERGFVNGAIAVVCDVLVDYNPSEGRHTCIFTARLTTGSMILVHPVSAGRAETMHEFLPCTYGYATTIRRAQGASLDYVCLYFDANFPPDRGYGYVGASRCRNAAGLFYFKRIRRTDWLPIGGGDSDEESERGSVSNASNHYDDSEPSDCDSDRSRLRSDGELSDSDTDLDEDGFPIVEDPAIVGDGDFTCEGEPEPLTDYADLFLAKRRKTAE
jgi:hypothetical protein